MNKATELCERSLKQVRLDRGGQHGPIRPEYVYDVMCSDVCVESDELHREAMDISDCNCLELSTDVDSPSWHMEGDWCHHNTARMMCRVIDFCGSWGCDLGDFFCPRYEYNKIYVKLRSKYGSCNAGGTLRASLVLPLAAWLLVTCMSWVQTRTWSEA